MILSVADETISKLMTGQNSENNIDVLFRAKYSEVSFPVVLPGVAFRITNHLLHDEASLFRANTCIQ